MQKQGRNPITIRPLGTHGDGNVVAIGRIHIGTGGGIGVGRATPKSTRLIERLADMTKMFTIAVYNEKAVEAAEEAGENPADLTRMITIDENQFLDAIGHLFPYGELALAHLNGDVKLLKEMLDTFRSLAAMQKDGEDADPEDPSDEGHVTENDDNHTTLTGLIDEARGYMKRLNG